MTKLPKSLEQERDEDADHESQTHQRAHETVFRSPYRHYYEGYVTGFNSCALKVKEHADKLAEALREHCYCTVSRDYDDNFKVTAISGEICVNCKALSDWQALWEGEK